MNEYRFREECIKNLGYFPKIKILPQIGQVSRFKDETKTASNIDGWIFNVNDNLFKIGVWSKDFDFLYIDNKFDAEKYTKEEKREYYDKSLQARILAENNLEKIRKEVANSASHKLDAMNNANYNHKYLINKNIKPYGQIRQQGNLLYLPVFNSFNGELQSYQTIDDNGDKRFLKNGKMKGGCIPINAIKDDNITVVGLCEGYATGSSLVEFYESTEPKNDKTFIKDTLFIVCFSASNLINVAKNIRLKFPDADIIIFADDDKNKIGLTKAKEVRDHVTNVQIKCPDFNYSEKNLGLSDYNDFINFRNLLNRGVIK